MALESVNIFFYQLKLNIARQRFFKFSFNGAKPLSETESSHSCTWQLLSTKTVYHKYFSSFFNIFLYYQTTELFMTWKFTEKIFPH